jgi:uncharacterized protein YcaQ
MPETLTNSDARRLLLQRQGLCRPARRKLTAKGLQALIEDLGYVQLDSISTVARAHHMILFSRNETYRPKLLTRLIETDRSLFENWTHDAAIIPTAFFPYWRHRFAREETALRARWRKWRRAGFEDAMDEVLARVRAEGPTRARDLTPDNGDGPKKDPAASWWDWHPGKTALEYHWRCGALAICRREGFQKVYDLTERVIPPQHLGPPPDPAAFRDWACRAALARLGIATSGEIANFWNLVSPKEAAAWCKAQLGKDLIEVLVTQADGGKPRLAYAKPDVLEEVRDLPPAPPRIRALSPFDPVIRNRQRLERVFGFSYRIEVFVPAAKRLYGYYVFPLLEGERLIGRIDMKHDKAADTLKVSSLWLEPKVRLTPARQARLEAELDRQRRFIGAERVVFVDGYVKVGA